MKITDPRELLDAIDLDKLQEYLGYQPFEHEDDNSQNSLQYVEPFGTDEDEPQIATGDHASHTQEGETNVNTNSQGSGESPGEVITGHTMRLGDFIDTDAVSRAMRYATQPMQMLIHHRLLRQSSWLLPPQTKNSELIVWNSLCLNSENKSEMARTSLSLAQGSDADHLERWP
jgi:hypothetical protein